MYTATPITNRDIHIRLKLQGSREKRDLFNWLVTKLDTDWPWAPAGMTYQTTGKKLEACPKCGGMNWRMPQLDLSHLTRLLKQVNDNRSLPGYVKLRMKSCVLRRECEAAQRELAGGNVETATGS